MNWNKITHSWLTGLSVLSLTVLFFVYTLNISVENNSDNIAENKNGLSVAQEQRQSNKRDNENLREFTGVLANNQGRLITGVSDLAKESKKNLGSIASLAKGYSNLAIAESRFNAKQMAILNKQGKKLAVLDNKNYITTEEVENIKTVLEDKITKTLLSAYKSDKKLSKKISKNKVKIEIVSEDIVELKKAEAPIGSMYFSQSSITPANGKWQLCDGTNNTPNVMGTNAFLRGGIYDGVLNEDKTAVNGLLVVANGNHNHTATGVGNYNQNLSGYGLVGVGGFASVYGSNTGYAGNHSHGLSGDTETAPVNYKTWVFCKTK